MKAIQLYQSSEGVSLQLNRVPEPSPGKEEVLIQVHAAGVTPSELDWYPTTHTKAGAERKNAIPGHEFSGTVVAFGEDVTGLTLGQPVYGMNDWFAEGATAELCLTIPPSLAPKPAKLTHAETATIPIGAAVNGIEPNADVQLKPGDILTIHQITGWNEIGQSVTIKGQVKFPGSYGFQEGERLSSVLRRAGGMRNTAYPEGAVLIL